MRQKDRHFIDKKLVSLLLCLAHDLSPPISTQIKPATSLNTCHKGHKLINIEGNQRLIGINVTIFSVG